MTDREARAKGYRIIWASAIEVGLLKNDKGIRTWWAGEFGMKLPGFEHPEIQRAIDITERWPDEA